MKVHIITDMTCAAMFVFKQQLIFNVCMYVCYLQILQAWKVFERLWVDVH